MFTERLISPIPPLVEAAGLAPFPLPKVPAKVKQAWLFKSGAGDVPTLPAVMFQLYAMEHYAGLLRLLRRSDPDFAARLPASREAALGGGGLQELVRGIRQAVGELNEVLGEHRLRTRIGLHAGRLLPGNIGAMDHYEYSVPGDMVNTAARIQSVNKTLGMRVLASQDVMEGVSAVVTREPGSFLLVGKHTPVMVHELVCKTGYCDPVTTESITRFAWALAACRSRDWQTALHMFEGLLNTGPGDPAVRLYVEECRRLIADPPTAEWTGVIVIASK